MRKRNGFSLLELVVVLVIIGILATLVSVRISGTLTEAQQTRIDADLAMLVTAGEQFAQRHPEETAATQSELVAAGVLAQTLESPVQGCAYSVRVGEGRVTAALKKGDEVYEKGDYRAEKTSTRLYLD